MTRSPGIDAELTQEEELNLTPMIDCVFLLLIFFMVTTVFQQPHSLQVELPEARQGQLVEDKKLVASITADGRMEVNRHPVTMADLPDLLARERASTRSLTLIVRTDRKTRHGLVLELMEVAKSLRVDKIVLATEELQP